MIATSNITKHKLGPKQAFIIDIAEVTTQQAFWERMSCDEKFTKGFVELLIEATDCFGAFYLEFPRYVPEMPVRFRVVDASHTLGPYMSVAHDEETFREYLEKGVTSFHNLSGDTLLVVPQKKSLSTNYAHIKSFITTAHQDELIAVFTDLAKNVKPGYYVSTHGVGVSWLHFRICEFPKYYAENPDF